MNALEKLHKIEMEYYKNHGLEYQEPRKNGVEVRLLPNGYFLHAYYENGEIIKTELTRPSAEADRTFSRAFFAALKP